MEFIQARWPRPHDHLAGLRSWTGSSRVLRHLELESSPTPSRGTVETQNRRFVCTKRIITGWAMCPADMFSSTKSNTSPRRSQILAGYSWGIIDVLIFLFFSELVVRIQAGSCNMIKSFHIRIESTEKCRKMPFKTKVRIATTPWDVPRKWHFLQKSDTPKMGWNISTFNYISTWSHPNQKILSTSYMSSSHPSTW